NGGSGNPMGAINAAAAIGTPPRDPEGLESNSAGEVSRADESTAAARAAEAAGYAARTGSFYDPHAPTYAAEAAAVALAAAAVAGDDAILANALLSDFQGLVALSLPHFPEEG